MPSSQPDFFSADSIQKMIGIMENLVDKIAEIVNQYHYKPTPDSRAAIEMACFADKGLVEDVYARASLCFESAADHFMAFIDTLKQPAKTLSPYTCVRSLMESCAIALWLLDLDIDVRKRVGRCYGYRYREFKEQIKFFQSDKTNPAEAQKEINRIYQRMAEVEAEALDLGYPKLTDKNGNMLGLATHMPPTVELIKMTLDRERDYRLLSGIAHSYLWATRQVGFQLHGFTNGKGLKAHILTKHAHPKMIIFGIILAVPTLTRVLWVMGKLLGWNMQEIEGLLVHTFDQLHLSEKVRFWNQ